jgi:uncharacterized damage-inducible protein DinB
MSGASMTGFQRLAEGNVAFLQQGVELIERLTDDQFAVPPSAFQRGGVGPHFRHILDHYDCFLDGLERGRVDYDARHRDARTERERSVALARIAEICRRLRGLDPRLASAPIQATLLCAEPPGTRPLWSATSVVRELQFLASHTVHHYAVIAAMLRPQGVEPGADFGVAPSTLVYERENAACAR